jgi:putative NADH-flavin reductase
MGDEHRWLILNLSGIGRPTWLRSDAAAERVAHAAEDIQQMAGTTQLLRAAALAGDADLVALCCSVLLCAIPAYDEEYAEIADRSADFLAEIERETAAANFTYAELDENDED